jgi:hypothetical protein
MNPPICANCTGIFVCGGCGKSLRSQLSAERRQLEGNAGDGVPFRTSPIHLVSPYATTFKVGPRGGALVPLNAVLTIECFVPYEEKTGQAWPLMPMPFLGTEIIHTAGGKPSTAAQEFLACKRHECACDLRPNGWVLPRAVARAILGVSDAFMAEFGRALPGCLPTWELQFSTPEFMKQVVFDPTFAAPTRAKSRAARVAREIGRGRGCKTPRPAHRRPRS